MVPNQPRPTEGEIHLAESRYDQVSSLLIALLILLGTAVAVMFLIWLTSRLVFLPRAVPVTLVEDVSGRGDHPLGFERDFEVPGAEEVPELAQPQLEASLQSVSEAISNLPASFDVLDVDVAVTSRGEGGLGDSRPLGPRGEGDDIIPRWERWEIRWTSNKLSTYARQLDYFRIELGAAGGKATIDYARNLAKPRPDSRSAAPEGEERLYMTWKTGSLAEFDRALLTRAGVDTRNRFTMQFYPADVENELAAIEKDHAGSRSIKEIAKTVFGVRTAGRGFEFYVIDQRFRALRD